MTTRLVAKTRSSLPRRWFAITFPRLTAGAAAVTGRTARGAAFATIEVDDRLRRSRRTARATLHGAQNKAY